MKFENLANELILEIFDYFSGVDLVLSFFNLNERFNRLIDRRFEQIPLDFRSISKKKFDQFFPEKIVSLKNSIRKLNISDDDETPGQIDEFLRFISTSIYFNVLTSLKIYSIGSSKLLLKILDQCPWLTHLEIRNSSINFKDIAQENILDRIWALPKISHCLLDFNSVGDSTGEIRRPRLVSNSLRSISVKNGWFSLDNLLDFVRSTPNVEEIDLRLRDASDIEVDMSPIHSIKKVEVCFNGTFDRLEIFRKVLVNLTVLWIEVRDVCFNGDVWRKIIDDQILDFRFSMFFKISEDLSFDESFSTFETDFWVAKRRCSIVSHFNSETRWAFFYSFPFHFSSWNFFSGEQTKTNCHLSRKVYRSVRTLRLNDELDKFAKENRMKFPSVENLETIFPLTESFRSVLGNFSKIKHLDLLCRSSNVEKNSFNDLIGRCENLYSLTTDFLTFSQLSTVRTGNKPIRRLDLISYDGHFYGFDSIDLITSFLDDRCEVLLINFENRHVALAFIERFNKLRALGFQSADDRFSELDEHNRTNDEFIQFFKSKLPANFNVSRDENEISAVRIWI